MVAYVVATYVSTSGVKVELHHQITGVDLYVRENYGRSHVEYTRRDSRPTSRCQAHNIGCTMKPQPRAVAGVTDVARRYANLVASLPVRECNASGRLPEPEVSQFLTYKPIMSEYLQSVAYFLNQGRDVKGLVALIGDHKLIHLVSIWVYAHACYMAHSHCTSCSQYSAAFELFEKADSLLDKISSWLGGDGNKPDRPYPLAVELFMTAVDHTAVSEMALLEEKYRRRDDGETSDDLLAASGYESDSIEREHGDGC